MKQNPKQLLEQYIIGKDQDNYQILETMYEESAEIEFEINSHNSGLVIEKEKHELPKM